MERNYKIEIKWALIFAFMTLLWVLFEKSLGLHSNLIQAHAKYTNLFAIPAIVIYVLALLDKRSNHYRGRMTYLQGFTTGLIITGIVTLLSPLTQAITSTLISPDYFPNIIAYSVESGKMTLSEADSYFNLSNYIKQALIGAAMMGIVTSSIVAIFTIRKSK